MAHKNMSAVHFPFTKTILKPFTV